LKYLKSVKAQPDLVVLDVNMPVMDGRQTLVKLQEDKDLKSIPVVVLTTSSSDVDKKFFEKKNIEMLVKPWNSKEIQQTVERLLHLVHK
jgi:CheY-like chemotaxis protein